MSNQDQPKKKDNNFIPFTDVEERLLARVEARRSRVEERFPLGVALAATFGFVAVLYGFEKMIDRVDFFVNHPWTLLVTGVVILLITGAVFKKLD